MFLEPYLSLLAGPVAEESNMVVASTSVGPLQCPLVEAPLGA